MTAERRPGRRFPPHGLVGLAVLLGAEALLFAGFGPVRTFFTPIVWTGYILLADGLVLARTGRSQLSSNPAELLRCALLSIPIWLIFEAYNLRLENWTYVGLPDFAPLRLLGYGWSFATILPALFETSDLLLAFFGGEAGETPGAARRDDGDATPGTQVALVTLGGLCLALPLLVPPLVAPYLFGLVWIGFVFLLAPINASLGRWSPFGKTRRGRALLVSLLAGGLWCGLLWEFWNYWAGAKWLYIFPMFQGLKLFEMPLPGFLGFPPFAVECYLLYDFLAAAWRGGWGRARLTSA